MARFKMHTELMTPEAMESELKKVDTMKTARAEALKPAQLSLLKHKQTLETLSQNVEKRINDVNTYLEKKPNLTHQDTKILDHKKDVLILRDELQEHLEQQKPNPEIDREVGSFFQKLHGESSKFADYFKGDKDREKSISTHPLDPRQNLTEFLAKQKNQEVDTENFTNHHLKNFENLKTYLEGRNTHLEQNYGGKKSKKEREFNQKILSQTKELLESKTAKDHYKNNEKTRKLLEQARKHGVLPPHHSHEHAEEIKEIHTALRE